MEELSILYLDLTVTIVFELLNILDVEFEEESLNFIYVSSIVIYLSYLSLGLPLTITAHSSPFANFPSTQKRRKIHSIK